MAASTAVLHGLPVLGLRRPKHEVDHVHFALCNDVILGLARESSKGFICYKLMSELTQRNSRKKWAVLLTDDNKDHNSTQLIEILTKFLPDEPITYFENHPRLQPSLQSLISGNSCQNTLVTSSDILLRWLNDGCLKAEDISLVILNFCTPLHSYVDKDCLFKQILAVFHSEIVRPRIVGLIQVMLTEISNALDLKEHFDLIESMFGFPLHLSSDCFAMNNFGEEIPVETLVYDENLSDTSTAQIHKILKDLLTFLCDVNMPELSKFFQKFKAIVAWLIEVLVIFGLWNFKYKFKSILKTLESLQTKEWDSLVSQFCKSQFELIEVLVNSTLSVPTLDVHSQLMYNICNILAPYQEILCETPSIPKDSQDATDGQNCCDADCTTQEIKPDERYPAILEVKLAKLKPKTRFRCVIITRRTSFAKMLSKQINYLSSSNEKYIFLKAGCITQSRSKTPDAEVKNQQILSALQQGVINIIVTTKDLLCDLVITWCNVLVHFGMPDSYAMYCNVKQNVRGIAAKFVVVLPEKQLASCVRNLQTFEDIEGLMEERVSDFISLKKKESMLKRLGEDKSLPCYAPFGEDGPQVSMISCIQIINRYCFKISKVDLWNVRAQFITEKKDISHNTAEVSTILYLPFGCCCQGVVKGPAIPIGADDCLDIAILKSKMATSLQCVRQLHENGNMDDDLQLTEELFVDAIRDEIINCELEDEGKGRAGTNKRKRAYEMEVPSFYKDNMPIAKEPLFLYKIELGYSKHQTSIELEQQPDSEIMLGILSRKPLPSFPKFTIYPPECELSVSITTATSSENLLLDDECLKRIREFHKYIFQDLLKFNTQCPLSEEDGYLIVPLQPTPSANDVHIHFHFLKEFELMIDEEKHNSSRTAHASNDFSVFENKVIQCSNECANRARSTKFFVVEVCNELHPSTKFPDPEVASTFAEYYVNRYGVDLNPDQPLLRVNYVSTQVNYLFPRGVPKEDKSPEDASVAREKPRRTEIHLMPELCVVLPFSASAWRLMSCLPTIVYRLSTLLLAEVLRCRIQAETGVGCEHWPADMPVPELGMGDSMGEDRISLGVVGKPGALEKSVSDLRFHDLDVGDSVCEERLDRASQGYIGTAGALDESVSDRQDQNGSDRMSTPPPDKLPSPDQLPPPPDQLTPSSDKLPPPSNKLPPDQLPRSPDKLPPSPDQLPPPPPSPNKLQPLPGQLPPSPDQLPSSPNQLPPSPNRLPPPDKLLPSPDQYTLPSPTSDSEIGPCLALILRALTAKSAGSCFHSERLEVLGDVLLKLEVGLEMFLVYLEKDEWALSMFRGHLVSNDMLSKQGRRLGLPGFLFNYLPDIAKNTTPPGFTPRQVNGNGGRDVSLNTFRHQVIGDKHVANCVEALIGAYLVSCGRSVTRRVMIWFGVASKTSAELQDVFNTFSRNIKSFNESPDGNPMVSRNGDERPFGHDSSFLPDASPESCPIPEVCRIEEEVGYRFENKQLLYRALTHASYSRSLAFVTESYQRLEFLGDAVLDYVVTLHLYSRFPHLNHGDLTDFRSALVNNFTVAFLAVQKRLHKSVRGMSPFLLGMMGKFVEFLEEQEAKQGASWKTSIDAFVVGNPDVEESDVEVPKVLGDVFEALVAAVFLDCGMNVDVVWRVFYPMLQPFIDYYTDNIPRSPVRTLQEMFPDQVTFSLARLTLSKKFTNVCKVHVVGYGTFEANGRTAKIAKSSVARIALKHIRNAVETN